MPGIPLEDRRNTEAVARGARAVPRREPADSVARWIALFIAVGIAVRTVRYLLRFPLWGDEAMLAMNLLDRDYAGLMRPLDFHQVAPLLFLWAESTAVKCLGFHEWSLRLFPFLCSLASLFLFHRLARHLLRGPALVLAMGIFAVSYSCIRYSSETKPYGVDLMISTLLLLLAVRWWRRPDDTRWLWGLTAAAPLALGLSYPAVFVAGGVSLAIAAVLFGTRSRRGWWHWIAYNVSVAASFAAWYDLAIRTQSKAELEVMGQMWKETFPPHDSFLQLAGWLLEVHTGPLMAVPIGGEHYGSSGTLLLCLIGAAVLIAGARYRLVVLCAGPFALNLLAAAMHRFPYGGHMRLAMHLVPIICIVMGVGAAAALKRLVPNGRSRQASGPASGRTVTRPTAVAAGLLIALGATSMLRDFCLPGKEQQEIRKRDFAAWFWSAMEREHEVACMVTDFQRTFPPPGVSWQNCVSTQFLCNERIYSPRHAKGLPLDLGRVSRRRPLVCVQYWSHLTPYDQAALDAWLKEMQQQFDLIDTHHYPMLQDNDRDRTPEPPDRVETYTFIPKQ